ncbi:MAG: wax ester/triacylglycerol synthase family O-acyltransferase [Actinobacteria bacterium]|jgi:WS/DGAT/MGAT family acyltransferase|nr:wax ester/triacylglycerol synthase family O-acyltransferase [Actinomycetota bacterium]
MDPLDAAFLALETRTMHMHVGALAIFDTTSFDTTSQDQAANTAFTRLREIILGRIHTVEAMRRRAIQAPLGMDFPVWIEDPAFNIDNHLHSAGLPPPGGPSKLAHLVAEIMERKLDTDKPLWEIHMVQGIESGVTGKPENGRLAIVAKMHHCILDGESGADLLAAVLDDGPTPRQLPPPESPWIPDPVPSLTEMLVHVATGIGARTKAALDSAARTASFISNVTATHNRDPEQGGIMAPFAPHLAPGTTINGAISPYRSFTMLDLPLTDIKLVAHASSTTVNHVILASVAGALRKLLDSRGERPDRSLISLVPVSQHGDTAIRRSGNNVSAALVSLATHVKDPLDRLTAIAAGSRHAISNSAPLYDNLLKAVSQVTVPGISHRLAAAVSKLKLLDKVNLPFNIVISNVRGPSTPLWCAGNRMTGLYPIGPLVEGIGINVTAMSYMDRLGVGILACKELVPDLDDFTRYLGESFTELEKAVSRRSAGNG